MTRRDELEQLSKAYVEAFWATVPLDANVATKTAFIFEELEYHLACLLLYFTAKAQKAGQNTGLLQPIAIAVSALKVLRSKAKEN